LIEIWNNKKLDNNWNYAQIEFEVNPPTFLLAIEAQINNQITSSIALDNIQYLNDSCLSKNSCI
jgi:hypothetical protein